VRRRDLGGASRLRTADGAMLWAGTTGGRASCEDAGQQTAQILSRARAARCPGSPNPSGTKPGTHPSTPDTPAYQRPHPHGQATPLGWIARAWVYPSSSRSRAAYAAARTVAAGIRTPEPRPADIAALFHLAYQQRSTELRPLSPSQHTPRLKITNSIRLPKPSSRQAQVVIGPAGNGVSRVTGNRRSRRRARRRSTEGTTLASRSLALSRRADMAN
jgi:hypothetical protein